MTPEEEREEDRLARRRARLDHMSKTDIRAQREEWAKEDRRRAALGRTFFRRSTDDGPFVPDVLKKNG